MDSNRRIVILPYKMGSQSAKALQASLNDRGYRTLRVYPDRRYRPRPSDFIINWGYSGQVKWGNSNITINKTPNVSLAINKYETFKILKDSGVRTPEFTTQKEEANWDIIYTRHDLCSSKGKGIAIFHRGDILPNAPLYVQGIETKGEYRVHVMNGEVIDYAKKRQKRDTEYTEAQLRVRNHDNGWVFARQDLRQLEDVKELAIKAIQALGLDFGSVDIVKDMNNVPYVLEVNTASGITGTTLENYTNKILSLI